MIAKGDLSEKGVGYKKANGYEKSIGCDVTPRFEKYFGYGF